MCGRARCSCSISAVATTYGVPGGRIYRADRFRPRHNLHPGHTSPVIVRAGGYERHCRRPPTTGKAKGGDTSQTRDACQEKEVEDGDLGERAVVVMHWGLIPSWHKEGEKLDFFRAFNARSETVAVKPMFRRLADTKRCLVCVEGFYEWKKDKKGQKQPFYCHSRDPSHPLLSLAGLYDVWYRPPRSDEKVEGAVEEEVFFSFTILTTEAAPSFAWLHDRMPLILQSKEEEEAWLEGGAEGGPRIAEILPKLWGQKGEGKGKQGGREVPELICEPVSKRMNSMAYEGEDCAVPIVLEEEGKEGGGKGTLDVFFGGRKGRAAVKEDHGKGREEGEGGKPAKTLDASRKAKKEEGAAGEDEVQVLTPSRLEEGRGGNVGDSAKKPRMEQAVERRGAARGGEKASRKGGAINDVTSAEKRQRTMQSFFPLSK